jgi:hypothetical protein
MIKLFVENQEVDVNVSFSTLITYAIDDIKDFGAKNTNFSKTIVIPGTKRNNVFVDAPVVDKVPEIPPSRREPT